MDDFWESLYKRYSRRKNEKDIVDLMRYISSGKGTYKDLYNYASKMGSDLGQAVKEGMSAWDFMDDRVKMGAQAEYFLDIMEFYSDDITDQAQLVQKAFNDAMDLGLKPQTAPFDNDLARDIAGKFINGHAGLMEKAVENFGMKHVDRTIHENADFLSKTGFKMKVVREYDNVGVHTDRKRETCRWCLERAGTYDYLAVKNKGNKVWQRHEGCGCSIEFYNENGKKETVNNFVKMTKRKASAKVDNTYKKTYNKSKIRGELEQENIEYRRVELLRRKLSEDEIIKKLAGGDKTDGSCASLALAYIGNRCGYDVTDYRDGESRKFFSSNSRAMSELDGVKCIVESNTNDFVSAKKLMESMDIEKEYCLCVGHHAAIVRRTGNGYEYLEMQAEHNNGFRPFRDNTLEKRFGCVRTHTVRLGGKQVKISPKSVLFDVDSFDGNEEFRNILGYLNTATDKQIKGAGGHEK